jgi:hypothetical protein
MEKQMLRFALLNRRCVCKEVADEKRIKSLKKRRKSLTVDLGIDGMMMTKMDLIEI